MGTSVSRLRFSRLGRRQRQLSRLGSATRCETAPTWRYVMKKMTSPLVAIALLVAAGSLVTACHTVEGAGQDVQQAGQAVEQTAHEANDGNPNTP